VKFCFLWGQPPRLSVERSSTLAKTNLEVVASWAIYASLGKGFRSRRKIDFRDTMPRHEILKTSHGKVVMVPNHAANSPATDDNGPGVAFSMTVGVSAPGNFSSASLLVIDKDTSVANGPTQTAVTPAAKITIDLTGIRSAS
jgi:hypothetical protein